MKDLRMRSLKWIGVLTAASIIAGCESQVTAPVLDTSEGEMTPLVATADISHRCAGEIVSGIASTWPWAHDERQAFPPPPGAIRLWLTEFGPEIGISSIRELQALFCSQL